jgi:heme/copper-type cytochrome/quinol oxidase subunit 2
MQMVGFHFFDLAIMCGMLLVFAAVIAVLVYFIVRANTRRRNLP